MQVKNSIIAKTIECFQVGLTSAPGVHPFFMYRFKPPVFLAWAQEKGFTIPDELRSMIVSNTQTTINDEKKCQQWLEDLMANNSTKGKTKSEYKQEAEQKFGVGKNQFNRAWANAINSTGNSKWNKGGRPKKEK